MKHVNCYLIIQVQFDFCNNESKCQLWIEFECYKIIPYFQNYSPIWIEQILPVQFIFCKHDPSVWRYTKIIVSSSILQVKKRILLFSWTRTSEPFFVISYQNWVFNRRIDPFIPVNGFHLKNLNKLTFYLGCFFFKLLSLFN